MYRIQKSENIQGQIKEIYYEGDYRWNTDFDVRNHHIHNIRTPT